VKRKKALRTRKGKHTGRRSDGRTSVAERLKELLGLKPLPSEGGYYVESYRSSEMLAAGAVSGRAHGTRVLSTAIYYLLTPDTCSRLHRLASDEIYHFYLGDPVELLQLLPDGTGRVVTLGPNLVKGMVVQAVVPRGTWQGSRLRRGGRYALMGTTMAPGFDPADCEFGGRHTLLRKYPRFRTSILALTAS
jgi:predicted cupin superfamily sugar epimerase